MDKKVYLSEREIPASWYNVAADLPTPPKPPLDPRTKQPLMPNDLAAIFPMGAIEQEISTKRWIPIPDEIRNVYRIWRPTPLVRADRLEAAIGTPAEIWFKNESVCPTGSHKLNSAVAQAYLNSLEGVKRLTTETGGGQWGSSLAFACAQYGLECAVYMVRVSYNQKPYRASMMRTWGASVTPSPSNLTATGRAVLESDPNNGGSLGTAISEAVEDALSREDTRYSLGSVLSHVILHQTVIGLELRAQFSKIDRWPDIMIGCAGGGSNVSGFVFPFIPEKLDGKAIRLVAVEPSACPSLTKGKLAYDFGDLSGLTPMMRMYTLGSQFIPPGMHAGGLRYHGMAPLLSAAVEDKLIEATSVTQTEVFDAALLFARTEGIIPAPESSHAIRVAIKEAQRCKLEGKKEIIVFNLTGHGLLDMSAYDAYLDNRIQDFEHDQEQLQQALDQLPAVD